MRVLFDQGTPVPLRGSLTHHEVSTAREHGWSTLKNGALLDVAEEQAFEVLVTTGSNLKYQQNLQARRIAIVVLSSTSWPRIQRAVTDVVREIDISREGSYIEVEIHEATANPTMHGTRRTASPSLAGRVPAHP